MANWSTTTSSGPKTQVELFVKLALVKKARLSEKEKATDNFLRNTLHGLVDDILQRKERVDITMLFSGKKGDVEKLLVEGAPGIGKTKLACHLCTKWANGELLKQYDLVIFVQLRRFQTCDKDFGIQDIIKNYLTSKRGESAAEELINSEFKSTLLILDGWDELSPDHRSEFSFFHDIVSGNRDGFQKASVMVTSRCTVSSSLCHLVDKHVEVLGFDAVQVREYVSSRLPQKKEIIFSHFRKFPNIQALSHIPLTLDIICSVLQDRDDLPSTLTPLYDLYIRKILLINLKRHRQYRELSGLPSLSELPAKVLTVVKSLAQLALKGLLEDHLVFERKHLEEIGLKVHPGFDAYGLFSLIPYDDGAGDSHFYQFCHLTLQEYLAAWHIKELNQDKRLELLGQYRLDPKYQVVWKFFSGLTKLTDEDTQEAIVSKTRTKNNLDVVFLLHCIYEANDPSVCFKAAAHLCRELHLDNKSLNATDCLCLAYTLAHSGGKWALNMRGCNMGGNGLDILYSHLLRHCQHTQSSCVHPVSFSRIE